MPEPTISTPSEIARETLRRLAAERIPPTPGNYRALYDRISGNAECADDISLQKVVADIAAILIEIDGGGDELTRLADASTRTANWQAIRPLVREAIRARREPAGAEANVSKRIDELLKRVDGALSADQRASFLDAISELQGRSPLAERLRTLLLAWTPPEERPSRLPSGRAPLQLRQNDTPALNGPLEPIRELSAFILESPCATLLGLTERLAVQARDLAQQIREATSPETLIGIHGQLRKFAFQVELAAQDQAELQAGVIHLLQLIVDNIGELVLDERWLGGQTKILRDILSQPLDIRSVDQAERRLREVIVKQSQSKAGLISAQTALKSMLSDFVGQLASFANETGAYSVRIDAYTEQISQAGSIVELQDVIQFVLRDTRNIRLSALRTQEELEEAKSKASAAEQRARELESNLAKASELAHQDQLTGTLNRRGLEESLAKEIRRSARRRSPLCLAVLDVDNFKQLNDRLGHQAGDQALVHLASVIRQGLRPQDSLARYGGEEFVILLPDTALADAQSTLVRVQRELTRRFFLHDNQRVLITFSAGVTQIPHGESHDHAIARADQLMYRAKTTGKNKVIAD